MVSENKRFRLSKFASPSKLSDFCDESGRILNNEVVDLLNELSTKGENCMSEKPSAIILPSWNSDEPRFIVLIARDGLADDRAFKNGKCVYNQRLGIVYSVEYIVDALNEFGNEIDKLKEENDRMKRTVKHLLYEMGVLNDEQE